MFRRMVIRTGLLAIACLGLLLLGGPANADPQGWPVAGNWGSSGGSSPASFGSYFPSYYPTYRTSIWQPGGDYGSAGPENSYPTSTTGGYYGSTSTEDYYRASTAESSRKLSVRLNLQVPGDAKIWFDGSQTNQTGTRRSFESPPLAVGPEYAYQLRIQWKQDGKDVTQTRQINVHAGDVINLTLGPPEVALAR